MEPEEWEYLKKLHMGVKEAGDPHNAQVGGSHYKLEIQPIDYIMKNDIPFAEGNVIKYVTRHRRKNGLEDIKKALQYLRFIALHHYGENL